MSDNRKTPRSVAIIMDGNGRWASQRGLDRCEGHIRGVESARVAIKAAKRCGVKYLTLYAFSTENWGRPDEEVAALMELLARSISAEAPDMAAEGLKLSFIGDRGRFSDEMQQIMREAEELTRLGEVLELVVALNYSSRDEMRRAVCSIAEGVKSGEIEVDDISEEMISGSLDTAKLPDPDLIIRTSGECRLSNFLMWQASYSELLFMEVLWPDFSDESFDQAMASYAARDRRFGLVE